MFQDSFDKDPTEGRIHSWQFFPIKEVICTCTLKLFLS